MLQVYPDLETLSVATAKLLATLAEDTIRRQGYFSWALSGGNTPKRLYQLLAEEPYTHQINWQAVHIFWGDERCVPADDPRSNFRMACESLLDHVPIPKQQIHPIPCDENPEQAARVYETELRSFLGRMNAGLDLVLLGLGDNGHTASLFPHSEILQEKERWVRAVFIPQVQMYRVSFTAPFINQAHQVIFLVSGEEKAIALQRVLEGDYQPQELPVQLIQPKSGNLLWMIDKAAGATLSKPAKLT
ncbi:MAG: 6-phosphogluconolactonase [Anaerolineales bacterium]